MILKFKFLITLGIIALGSFQPSLAKAADITYNEAEVLLNNLSKTKIGEDDHNVRWVKPVNIIINVNEKIFFEYLDQQIKLINKHNSSISLNLKSKNPNFYIEIVDEETFTKKATAQGLMQASRENCAYRIDGAEQEILQANVYIKDNINISEMLNCIGRGIMKGLGIGDSHQNGILLSNSALNPYVRSDPDLTNVDISILNFHYAEDTEQKSDSIKAFQKHILLK